MIKEEWETSEDGAVGGEKLRVNWNARQTVAKADMCQFNEQHAVCVCKTEGQSSEPEDFPSSVALPHSHGSKSAVSNTSGTAWSNYNIHGVTVDDG